MKRGLRTHKSAELVAWFHKALQGNVNFGADVTREQTVQLLRKVHGAGMLESVRGEEGDGRGLQALPQVAARTTLWGISVKPSVCGLVAQEPREDCAESAGPGEEGAGGPGEPPGRRMSGRRRGR